MKYTFLVLMSFFLSGIMLAQVDSGYVDIKKGQLFYRTYGEGEPLLVIVGGSGIGSDGYKVFGEELSANRMVILFDQRRCGRSLVKGPYLGQEKETKRIIEDIEKLRIHLKIEQWDILGQTNGALLGMDYIYKHPERAKKIIIASAEGYDLEYGVGIQKTKDVPEKDLTDLELMIKEEMEKEMKKKNHSVSRIKKLSAALRARYSIYNPENIPVMANWWLNEASFNSDSYREVVSYGSFRRKQNKNKQLVSQFAQFKNPVLVIHGAESFMNFLNPQRNAEIFPNSEMVLIEKCGHTMFIDAKEEFFKSINDFLNKELE